MLFVVKISIKYVSICEKGTTFTILSIQNISIGLMVCFNSPPSLTKSTKFINKVIRFRVEKYVIDIYYIGKI